MPYKYIAKFKLSKIIQKSYYFRLTNEKKTFLRIVVKLFGKLRISK